MPNYSDGTIQITDGSQYVIGSGTAFKANVQPGSIVSIAGLGRGYQIAAVTDDTHLILAAPVKIIDAGGGLTLTGRSYTVCTDFTPNLNLPLFDRNDPDKQTRINRALTLIDRQMAIDLVKSIT